MRKSCYKMKKLLILTACAAIAVSGCAVPKSSQSSQTGLTQSAPDVIVNNVDDHQMEDTIQEQKPPAYVYYIKGGNLMGADVNAELGTDTNPSVIMEGIGEGFSPKSHFYNTQYQAEDGSFRAVNIAGEGDSDNGKLIVICSQDRGSEVIYEGYTYSMMCGSRLLFLVNEIDDKTDETQSDLYFYTPAEGKQLLVSDIYDYRPSEDGSAICFTRADENYDETLYLYKDGEELLLAERMEIAGVDKMCDNIYAQRYVYDEEQEYCELTRIAADGESQEILTKADGVSDYYLNPDHGSVYYFSDREEDDRALYYWSEGENMLISQHLTAVWEYIQDAQWLDGMPMMVYTAEQDGAQRIFAVIDGTVSELLTPGFESDWINDYLMYVTGDNHFYLGVTEADSSYQMSLKKIDEEVATFFPQDQDQFVDAVPWSWEWE